MIVSLPWDDLAEVRKANDELWGLVADRLPSHLRGTPLPTILERRIPTRMQWASGRVILSQACGYDVVLPERNQLRIVATPCYPPPDATGPTTQVQSSSGGRRECDPSQTCAEPVA